MLPRSDLTRCAGLPTTTPLRTAFDLARRQSLVEGVVAVDALLTRRLVTLSELRALADVRNRWPGRRRLLDALDLASPGAESPMESRLRVLLVTGGLPRPLVQHEVFSGTGAFVARLDLAYERWRLGIEYEGAYHREAAQFQRDLRRINALRACGWNVLRFAAADIYREPDKVVALVRAQLSRQLTTGR